MSWRPIPTLGLLLPMLALVLLCGPSRSGLAQAMPIVPGTEEVEPVAHGDEPHETTPQGGGHGGSHGGDENILAFQPELGLYTVIVFLVLLFVLWFFAWGPLSKALQKREQRMEQAFAEAERARAEAAALLDQHRQQMDQAAEQVRAIMEEARRDARTTAESILQQAQAEAEAVRQRAERDIGLARDHALMEIWTSSADLAATVARRVLSREMTEEDHRRLVQSAIDQLPERPNGHHQGGPVA